MSSVVNKRESLPLPSCIHTCAQYPVIHVRKSREVISVEAVERGPCALQDQKSGKRRMELNSFPLNYFCFNLPSLVSVSEEGVWVWLSVDGHSCPPADNDFDVGSVDVFVGLDEVGSED